MFFRYHNLGSESRVLHSGGALGPPSFLLFSSIHYQTEFRNALCQEISCRERDPTIYMMSSHPKFVVGNKKKVFRDGNKSCHWLAHIRRGRVIAVSR